MPLHAAADRIDAQFAPWSDAASPGVAVGVVEGADLVYARGFGCANLEYGIPLTPQSVFHVASIAKPFTALATMLLVQDGVVRLEDDVRRWLPDVPDFGPLITVEHLLTHTSGLRDQWNLLTLGGWRPDDLRSDEDVATLVRRQRALSFAPGAEYLYCNTGFTLLARIVAAATGQTFRTFCQERVFGPLGMAATHMHDDPHEVVRDRAYAYRRDNAGRLSLWIPHYATVGATSLFTTVKDLARFARNLRVPVVGAQALARMAQPARRGDGSTLPYGYGLTLSTYRGLRGVGHDGADAGYRGRLVWYPEADLAVIVLANVDPIALEPLTQAVVDTILEGRGTAGPRASTAAVDEPARPADGLYWQAERSFACRVAGTATGIDVRLPGMDAPQSLDPSGPRRYARGPLTVTLPPAGAMGEGALVVEIADGDPQVLHLAQAARPSPADLAACAGDYRSEELGVTWHVQAHADGLRLVREKFPPHRLEPLVADAFEGPAGAVLVFDRPGGGRATGLRVSTRRSWNLGFARLADAAP